MCHFTTAPSTPPLSLTEALPALRYDLSQQRLGVALRVLAAEGLPAPRIVTKLDVAVQKASSADEVDLRFALITAFTYAAALPPPSCIPSDALLHCTHS